MHLPPARRGDAPPSHARVVRLCAIWLTALLVGAPACLSAEPSSSAKARASDEGIAEVSAAAAVELLAQGPAPKAAPYDARPTTSPTPQRLCLRGIIPTVLTPLTCQQQVDVAALEQEINFLLNAGVHGLLILGSVGEGAYLDAHQRELVIETTVKVVAGRRPIVVGIISTSTQVARAQLEQARNLGADAALVLVQPYYGLCFGDLRRHYQVLSEANLLPILYYHYPAATGLDLDADQIAAILCLPNVIGIKESILDLGEVKKHIRLTQRLGKVYFSGTALDLLTFLRAGGHGAMCPEAAVWPEETVIAFEAYCAGQRDLARDSQRRLFELLPLVQGRSVPVFVARPALSLATHLGVPVSLDSTPTQARLKAALALRGVPISPAVSPPLPQLTCEDRTKAAEVIRRITKPRD